MTNFAQIVSILGRDHESVCAFVLAKTGEYAELEEQSKATCLKIPGWGDFLNEQCAPLLHHLQTEGVDDLPPYPKENWWKYKNSLSPDDIEQVEIAMRVWAFKPKTPPKPATVEPHPMDLRTFYAPVIALWEAMGGLVVKCKDGLAFVVQSPQNILINKFFASPPTAEHDQEQANNLLIQGELKPRSSQYQRTWDTLKVRLSDDAQAILDAWTAYGHSVVYSNGFTVTLWTSHGEYVCDYQEREPFGVFRENTAPTPAALAAVLRGRCPGMAVRLKYSRFDSLESLPPDLDSIHQILATRELFECQREHKRLVDQVDAAQKILQQAELNFRNLLSK